MLERHDSTLKPRLKDALLLKDQCYVNGAWTGTGKDPVNNPATGELLAKVPEFGAEECTRAVEQAEKAFKSWSKLLAKERAAILRRWFDLIVANADDLALIMTSEQGKPLAEAKGEVLYAASFVEFYAEEAKRIYGETVPSPFPNSRIMVIRQPIGVIGAITPWNSPIMNEAQKAAPALAAGNAVIKDIS